MTTVRTDVFKLGDKYATLLGDEVRVGEMAPEFTSVVPGWGTVNPLQESKGKVIILSAVPSPIRMCVIGKPGSSMRKPQS